jgi:hypothetical protein
MVRPPVRVWPDLTPESGSGSSRRDRGLAGLAAVAACDVPAGAWAQQLLLRPRIAPRAWSLPGITSMGLRFPANMAHPDDEDRVMTSYSALCFCGTVRYLALADPVDAKLCHCRTCQVLHGAPMQWAAIFRKSDVRFTVGEEHLRFYNSAFDLHERILPCKVSCALCGTPIADDGRSMWLAFPSLFDFGTPPRVPAPFKPTCHIFYSMRVMEIEDGLPKWSGHKNESAQL